MAEQLTHPHLVLNVEAPAPSDEPAMVELSLVEPAPVVGLLMVPGFVRRVVVPLAGFAAVLAVVAAIGARWRMLTCVVAVLPVAVVIEWARTTYRAALADHLIRPGATLAATAVLLAGIVTAVGGIVAVLVDPSLINGAR